MNFLIELNTYIPQILEIENIFRSFQEKFENLLLDEKEISLLILMIITRTSENNLFSFAL